MQRIIKSYSPGSNLQKFIDMDVYRLSEPYTPMDTTALEKSPVTNQGKAPFGWGRLLYTIYGRRDGRNTWNDVTSQFQGGPKRGAFWVARMLVDGGYEKLMTGIERFKKRRG